MNAAEKSFSWAVGLRNVAVFLSVSLATMRALDSILPAGGDPIIGAKIDGFRGRMADCNVLFLGSSILHRGLDPAVFDATTAAAGLETRSFNMGVPGTFLVESFYVLQRVAEEAPPKLQWIVVEADGIAKVHNDGLFLTDKYIAWHDVATLGYLTDYVADQELSWADEAGVRWRNTVSCGLCLLGVGRGLPWLDEGLGVGFGEEEWARWLGPAGDGFCTKMDDPAGETAVRRLRFLENRQVFERKWRRKIRSREPSGPPLLSAVPFLRRIEELAASMGARAIFYTRTGSYYGADVVALAQAGLVDTLLRLDDAQKYPEVLDPAFTFDGSHYTRKGAVAFTRYLAELFSEHVERRSQ